MTPIQKSPYHHPIEALIENAICSVNLAILALEQPDMQNEVAYSIYCAKTQLEEIRTTALKFPDSL